MKKSFLFLISLLVTATAWSHDTTPLQFGVDNEIQIPEGGAYLSFTPQETDYYVFCSSSTVMHSLTLNVLSGDSSYWAPSNYDANHQMQCSNLGYPHKLYAGQTYIMLLDVDDDNFDVTANVVVRKGYIVNPDAESAELINVLMPLPTVAYEGQQVRLVVSSPGVTINNLTATAGGEPVDITSGSGGTFYSFTMPASDVIISGSFEIQYLQLGDNEVDFDMNGKLYAFKPEASGAYVFSMSDGLDAMAVITLNNNEITDGLAYNGQRLLMGVMAEANVTYYVEMGLYGFTKAETILNITKQELAPITIGENVIDAPSRTTFDYSFTPSVSGDYTFFTTGDADICPRVKLYLGDTEIGDYYNAQADWNFTTNLEEGVTYTLKACNYHDISSIYPIHLTVVEPVPSTIIANFLDAQPRSGKRYNIMGQPVGKDYKGFVIENGRKIIAR